MTGARGKRARVGRMVAGGILAAAVTGAAHAAHAQRDHFAGRQSSASTTMDCLVSNSSAYVVRFSAMQEGPGRQDQARFANFCREIPDVGKTYLTIDLLGRDIRAIPVALRVVEEEPSSPVIGRWPRQKGTVLEVPATIYRTGTVATDVEIARPGYYALIATIGDAATYGHAQLRIPFTVGHTYRSTISLRYRDFAAGLAATFFAVIAVIGYRAYRSYHPKTLPGTAGHFGMANVTAVSENLTRRYR